MPYYSWNIDANGGHYLIIWLNGYFCNDLADVTPTINRLWQIQSSLPLSVIDSILLNVENPEYGKNRLMQFIYSHRLNQPITLNWHQRTFGMSRMR